MKRLPLALLPLVVAAVFVIAWSCAHSQSSTPQSVQPSIQVFFSPKGGCTEACVKEIDNARKMILVQAYSFTSAPIAKVLVEAHNRGVDVRVILDKSQRGEKYSSADFVLHAGIQTFIDAKHAIAHNKVMVIDDETVITGSFNFTKAAEENNAENMLVIKDPVLAEKYKSNWDKHVEHSEPYEGKLKGYSETHHADKAVPSDPAPAAGATETSGYVASKNSQVFHKAGCKGAAKISDKNLVRYATRDEAIRAGKKPCHECNP